MQSLPIMDFTGMSEMFSFQLPRKINFGMGAINTIGPEAAQSYPRSKVLLIGDTGVLGNGLADKAIASLKKHGFGVAVFDGVQADCPLPVVEECMELVAREDARLVVGFGGGSSMDTAKAVALMYGLPGDLRQHLGYNKILRSGLATILVPTTAGTGSEISNAIVVADDQSGDKIACYSPYAFADLAIIDPLLTVGLPPRLTAETGMDAFSHALESFVTLKANPFSELLSLRAMHLIAANLPKAYSKGTHDLKARTAMCLGTMLGTMAIRSSGLGIVHGTSNPVAMNCHVSHGVAISLMMPAVMEFNLPAKVEKFAALARVMGEKVDSLSEYEAALAAVSAVRRFIKGLGLPTRLREVGATREDLPNFAKIAMKRSTVLLEANPRNATEKDLLSIFEQSW